MAGIFLWNTDTIRNPQIESTTLPSSLLDESTIHERESIDQSTLALLRKKQGLCFFTHCFDYIGFTGGHNAEIFMHFEKRIFFQPLSFLKKPQRATEAESPASNHHRTHERLTPECMHHPFIRLARKASAQSIPDEPQYQWRSASD